MYCGKIPENIGITKAACEDTMVRFLIEIRERFEMVIFETFQTTTESVLVQLVPPSSLLNTVVRYGLLLFRS